jgi:TolA-binding protein
VGASFDQANAARRSGDHRRAAELYQSLVTRYPATAEARASLLALGRMLLDDGDASGGLRSFEQYLSSGGALAEDAMLGRALALSHLRRSSDEAQAWSELVHEYPRSAHAERARRRLLELGAR